MIFVDLLVDKEGSLLGFSIKGHAQRDEFGKDVVCAAVSSASIMVANTITEILRLNPSLSLEEAKLFLRVKNKDIRVCLPILQGFKLHIIGLEEQYPENIVVNYLEV